jgi:hypothetical protein
MRPAHACVLIGDNDILTGEAHGPDRGRVHIVDAPFGCVRRIGLVLQVCKLGVLDPIGGPVRIDAGDIRPRRQPLYKRPVGVDDDHISDPKRLIMQALAVKHCLDRRLCEGGVIRERLVNIPTAGVLVLHVVRRADICLVGEIDDDRCSFTVGRVIKDLLADL